MNAKVTKGLIVAGAVVAVIFATVGASTAVSATAESAQQETCYTQVEQFKTQSRYAKFTSVRVATQPGNNKPWGAWGAFTAWGSTYQNNAWIDSTVEIIEGPAGHGSGTGPENVDTGTGSVSVPAGTRWERRYQYQKVDSRTVSTGFVDVETPCPTTTTASTTTTSTTTTSTTVPETTTTTSTVPETTSTTVPKSTTTTVPGSTTTSTVPTTTTTVETGRFPTCADVKAAGLGVILWSSDDYDISLDADRDGVACEENAPSQPDVVIAEAEVSFTG